MLALTQTRIDLYAAQQAADPGIPNVAPRRPINDSVPQAVDTVAAVRRLKRNKAPGISKMTSNHRKAWMKQALEPEEGKEPQLAAITGEVLFECFIDLCEAFDSVDNEEGLTILESRGAGTNLLRLLRRFGTNKRLHVDREASMALCFEQEEAPLKVDSSPPLSLASS